MSVCVCFFRLYIYIYIYIRFESLNDGLFLSLFSPGRKEMFYLTMHSTPSIYGYMASDIMVENHSDSEKGNPLPPHRLLSTINSKFVYMHHPTDRIAHTTAVVTPVVEHWLEREIAQWVHYE